MDTINNGTIQVKFDETFIRRDFVVPVVEAFVSEEFDVDLEDDGHEGVYFDPDNLEIDFNDYHRNDIDGDINSLQERLDPTCKKIWLESKGGINVYYGGDKLFVSVEKGKASVHDESERDLYYASDNDLIDILKKRGYVVTKKKEAKKHA